MAYAAREQTESSPRPTMIDLPRLCDLLGISLMTGHRLLRDGALPSYKVGGSWRFDELEVRDALRAQPDQRWVQGPRKKSDKSPVPA
jgi:excisionase family DNA binding protein